MIEHSVPQNVTSYQFHLIGNMTIKQFLLLLSGVGVAGLLYTTNIIGIIKWPLIGIFVLIGVAMAFVPYEERSLDQWMINFVKAMYRPTKFFWRRMGSAPDFFSFTPRTNNSVGPIRPGMSTLNRRRQVNQYLNTLKPASQQDSARDPLDMLGADTSGLNDLFSSVLAAKNVVPGEDFAVKPKLGVRSRPLKEQTVADTTPAIQSDTAVRSAVPTLLATEASAVTIEPLVDQTAASNEAASLRHAGQTSLETVGIVSMPTTQNLSAPLTPGSQSLSAPTQQQTYAQVLTPVAASTPPSESEVILPVVFNRSLPFPSLPDKPNVLIGMVYNLAGSILPNAILEIINEQGNTVRALKTNSLGQFYTSTPLPAGNYIIETEIEDLSFPKFSLHTENNILDPIEIRPTTQV